MGQLNSLLYSPAAGLDLIGAPVQHQHGGLSLPGGVRLVAWTPYWLSSITGCHQLNLVLLAVRLVQLVSATRSYRSSLPLTLPTGPKRHQDKTANDVESVQPYRHGPLLDLMLELRPRRADAEGWQSHVILQSKHGATPPLASARRTSARAVANERGLSNSSLGFRLMTAGMFHVTNLTPGSECSPTDAELNRVDDAAVVEAHVRHRLLIDVAYTLHV
jgi:hypothetical protein